MRLLVKKDFHTKAIRYHLYILILQIRISHSFIHSFCGYLLSTYYELSCVPGAEYTAKNKRDKKNKNKIKSLL